MENTFDHPGGEVAAHARLPGLARAATPRDLATRAGTAARTFRDVGHQRLAALCTASGLDACRPAAGALLDTFLDGWGDRRIGEQPAWPSDITDDHSPFELSLALERGRRELRFLIEVQGHRTTTLASSWEAARAVTERLARSHGFSLDRFHRIEELFAPRDARASFGLWHAVCLREGEPPDCKIYLNPAARGPGEAAAVVEEALGRLGFRQAWRFLRDHALGRPADRLAFFSLDLANHAEARVKVYAAHPAITAGEVEALLASAGSELPPGEAAAFCRAMAGDDGPYTDRPLDTCFAFTAGGSERPAGTTLYVPIRAYADDDQVATDRIAAWLEPGDRDGWRRIVAALATRPLTAGRGLIQWASVKRSRGHRRLTCYLAPELYAPLPPRPRRETP